MRLAQVRARCRAPLVAALLASVLLPAVPAHAYRTLGEAEGLPEGVEPRWEGEVRVHVASDPPTGLSAVELDRTVVDAISLWTTTVCNTPTVNFLGRGTDGPGTGDGLLSISFVRSGWSEAGRDPAAPGSTDVAYEVSPDGTSARLIDADIVLNADDFDWGSTGRAPLSVFPVLVHELGHALGMLQHPLCGSASLPPCESFGTPTVMNPLYLPELQSTLQPDDIEGLCAVYGPRDLDCAPACAIGEACAGGRCIPRECAGDCVSCASDADCVRGFCDGVCLEPLAAGETCTRPAECRSGLCEGGACAATCSASRCAPGQFCAALGACEAEPADFGAGCMASSDCVSRRCVEGERTGTFCTVECSARSECPSAFICRTVDGVDLCVPPPTSSCSSSRGGGRASLGTILLLALGVALRRGSRRIER